MSLIDERVVKMRFDNRSFEQNVKTSLSTIDTLKSSLNFDNAAKSFSNINKAADNVSMQGLTDSIDTVHLKFSALQVVAVTTLANITNATVNTVRQISKQITGLVTQGGITRALNIESAKFQLEGLGVAWDDISEDISYGVKDTAYGLDSAAKVASQLVASDIKLGKDMKTSLRAVSGVAAMTNSSYDDIGEIFTTIAGNGRLMTEQLRQFSSRGLNAAATLAEHIGVTEEEVRDMVTKGKIDFATFSEAMDSAFGDHAKDANKTFNGALSNMKAAMSRIGAEFATPSFENLKNILNALIPDIDGIHVSMKPLIGDFTNVAKSISDKLISKLKSVNLENVDKILKNITKTIENLSKGVKSFVKPIGEAFREVFTPVTGKQLVEITKKISELTEKFKMNESTSKNLKDSFKGLFSVFDILGNLLLSFKRPLRISASGLLTISKGVLSVTGAIGRWISKIDEYIKKNDIFNKAISKAISFIEKIKNKFEEAFKTITGKSVGEAIEEITNHLKSGIQKIKTTLDSFGNIGMSGVNKFSNRFKLSFDPLNTLLDGFVFVMQGVKKIIEKISPTISKVISGIGKALGNLGKAIADAIGSADFNTLFDIANGGLLIWIATTLNDFIESLTHVAKSVTGLTNSVKGLFSPIKDILNGVKGCLISWQKDIKAKTLISIAKALALITASILVLSLIDSDKLTAALVAMTVEMGSLFTVFSAMQKILDTKKVGSMNLVASALIGMASAVLILSVAMTRLAKLEWSGIAKGTVAVASLCVMMVKISDEIAKSSKKMSKSLPSILKSSLAIWSFAIAIRILTKSVIELAGLDIKQLIIGLTGVGALCAELALFLNNVKTSSLNVRNGLGLIALAAAIDILTDAVTKFSKIDTANLLKGLAGVGAVLLEITAFTKITKKQDTKSLLKTAVSMTVIGASMLIFGKAVANIGKLQLSELAKGLSGIALSLIIIAGAMKLMPDAKNMLSSSVSITILSVALLNIAKAMTTIGGMSWEEIAKGLIVLAASLTIIDVAMRNVGKDAVKNSAGLLLYSTSLMLLVPVLKALGNMSWEEIAKGLLTIAGVFTILGVAGYSLSPVISVIASLSFSLMMIGAASALFGAGLLSVSVALSAFSASSAVAVDAVIYTITKLLVALPDMLKALAVSLDKSLVAVVDCIVNIGMALIIGIDKLVPSLVETFLHVVEEVVKSIAKHVGTIVENLLEIIVGVINGLAVGIPDIIAATIKLFRNIIDALVSAFDGLDISGILYATAALAALLGMMTLVLGIVVSATVATAMLPLIGTNLGKFITNARPFLDAVKKMDPSSLNGAKLLAETVLMLTAAGVIDGLTAWFTGGKSMVKFGKEISAFAPYLQRYYKGIKGIDSKAVESSAYAGKALAQMANNLPKSGGFMSMLVGDSSLSEFAKQLTTFGPNLKKYADSVKGLDADSVVNSSKAARSIVDLAKSLPNSGGLISTIFGDGNLNDFAKQMSVFGPNLKKYADSVKGLDDKAVTSSANAAKALVELDKELPDDGGILNWFTGSKDISKFAEKLPNFGKKLKSYSDNIKGFDANAVTASSKAAESLTNLQDKLPNDGGIVQWFTGSKDISKFADKLPNFGKKLKAYSDSIKGFDANTVGSSTKAAESLAELNSKLPDDGGIAQWFTGSKDISRFGDKLPNLGRALKSYSDSIKGFDAGTVNASAKGAESLAKLVNNLPSSGGIVQWFTGEANLVKFTSSLPDLGESLKSYSDNIKGFDADAASNSAKAAESLANMAKNLPTDGGVFSLFTGNVNISDFADDLPDLGEALKSYSDNIKGFDSDGAINASNAASTLAEMAKNLPSNNGIFDIFSGTKMSISDFADKLPYLGKALKAYSNEIKDFDSDAATNAAIAAETLSEMAKNLPETGGIGEIFTGTNSIMSFSEQLPDLGKALKSYSDNIKDFDSNSANNSANAIKTLSEAAKNLPTSGGIFEVFTGTNSIRSFASQLPELGLYLKAYSDNIKDFDAGSVTNSSNAIKTLSEAAKNLPNSGSIFEVFTGTNSIRSFASQLPELGLYLKAYSDNLIGFRSEAVESSANAAKSLTELANNLPSNGLLSIFEGTNLATFGLQLNSFGTYFASYAETMKNVDANIAKTTSNAAESVIKLQEKLPKKGGWFSDQATLASFGSDMLTFAQYFKEYYDTISEVNPNVLSPAVSEISRLIDIAKGIDSALNDNLSGFGKSMTEMGKAGINGFIGEFTNASSKVIEAVNGVMTTMTSAISNKKKSVINAVSGVTISTATYIENQKGSFTTAGSQLMSGLTSGIKRSSLVNIVANIVSNMVSAIKDNYTDFYNSGLYLADGFISGMNDKRGYIESEARSMAAAAAAAARAELGIHSPSRVFYQIGSYAGQGLINALSDYSDKSYSAGQDIAESARSGLSTAISKSIDYLNGNIETQPVISPVLDLTDIEKGVRNLNGMLYSQRSFVSAGEINNMVNLRNQSKYNIVVDNADVVDAIKNMRGDMNDLGESVKRLRIILDTGTLVGHLADPIDAALGQRTTYRKRGN